MLNYAVQLPELRLLLSLLGKNTFIEPKENIHWELFLQLRKWHRLYIIDAKNYKENKQLLPASVQQTLYNEHQQETIRMIQVFNEYKRIQTALSDNKIAYIVLKGFVLSELLHGNYTKRNSRDIDLLFEKQNVYNALQILEQLGYELKEKKRINSKYLSNAYYEATLIHKKSHMIVEIHWQLSYEHPYFIETKHLFEQKKIVHIQGIEVPVLSEADSLIYLIQHAAHHAYARLFWLYDIHTMLEKYKKQTEQIINIINQQKLQTRTAQALQLCTCLFKTTLHPLWNEFMHQNKVNSFILEYPIQLIENKHSHKKLSLHEKINKLIYELMISAREGVFKIIASKLKHIYNK